MNSSCTMQLSNTDEKLMKETRDGEMVETVADHLTEIAVEQLMNQVHVIIIVHRKRVQQRHKLQQVQYVSLTWAPSLSQAFIIP